MMGFVINALKYVDNFDESDHIAIQEYAYN